MSWLIILLVVALALAPLLHFMPSKRQRRVASLRQHAALQGMFVEFRQLPEGSAERLGPDVSGGNTIYYGRRLAPPRRGESRSGTWLCLDGRWQALHRHLPVPGSLGDLADIACAASVDTGSCGIYWNEAGDEGDIDRIRDALMTWNDAL